MPLREGNCLACGASFPINVRTRRYCAMCQIIRDLSNSPEMKQDCNTCGKEFYPVKANYKVCPSCRFEFPKPDQYPTPCKECGKHMRPAPGIETHCISCIQEDKRLRRQYLARIRKVQTERINALEGPIEMTEAQKIAYRLIPDPRDAEPVVEERGLF